jgi:hypothetical protein
MFLGVSGSVLLVNEDDRKRLGDLISRERKRQFGTKSSAYKAAGVNAATWDRAEAGDSVREDRLAAIVRLLWPASDGDTERAMTRATDEWADWEDRETPLAHDETEADRVMVWAAEHFERVNKTLAEMADAIEALNKKVGGDDGPQTSTQKNDGPDDDLGGVIPLRPRPSSDGPNGEELSEPGETKVPAADRVDRRGDEESGGSDDRG